MKKSIFIILACTFFCQTSCNNGQEKNYFEKFEYNNSFCYNPNGNVINFDYVFFLPSKEMNSTVAKVIKNSVFEDLNFENIDFTVDNYKDVIDQYIKIYVDTTFKTDDIYLTEFDDEYHLYNYDCDKRDSLYFLNEDIIGKYYRTADYTGGDHGMVGCYYTYFDANTGIVYDYNNVFSDKEKVLDMINKRLNKMALFDSNDIIPQFELKPDTMVFVFNPGEVGGYADGVVDVPFAFEEIKDYMNNSTPIYKYFNKK